MKWSWRLGTVAGIGIYVHWTFLILIGWFLMVHFTQGRSLAESALGIALLLSVFACVVLHELGHALCAKRYGIRTRDITLLPIGGMARLERMPENPLQELWVALAGPAVNVVIVFLLGVVLVALGSLGSLAEWKLVGGNFLASLLVINGLLVVFNMLPAFPMDGGRVLRAVLAWKSGNYVWATKVAAAIGQGMAVLFGFLGLLGFNPFLLFIALFVFLAAQEEASRVEMKAVFRGLPVREAMITRYRTLSSHDPLQQAVTELLAGAQQDFPVVDDGRVAGMLLRHNLIRTLAEGRSGASVAECMLREVPLVQADEPLEAALERLRSSNASSAPVLRNGELVGLLTLENVGELVMVKSALEEAAQQRVPA